MSAPATDVSSAVAATLSTESANVFERPSAWQRLKAHWGVRIGGVAMLLLALIALAAPVLGTVDPTLFDPGSRDLLPGASGDITTLEGESIKHGDQRAGHTDHQRHAGAVDDAAVNITPERVRAHDEFVLDRLAFHSATSAIAIRMPGIAMMPSITRISGISSQRR